MKSIPLFEKAFENKVSGCLFPFTVLLIIYEHALEYGIFGDIFSITISQTIDNISFIIIPIAENILAKTKWQPLVKLAIKHTSIRVESSPFALRLMILNKNCFYLPIAHVYEAFCV